MRNRFLAIIISVFLMMPNVVFAEETVTQEFPAQTETAVTDDIPNANLDEDNASVEIPEDQDGQTPYKKPYSKKKVVKKFLFAMLGVGISSFLIFFCLSLYNKIRDKFIGQVKTLDGKTSLQTPDDLDSAVKTFLEKTDWKE